VATVTLQPAPFFESIQVTSARGAIARVDPTVATAVFPSSELLTSGPLNVDDALKSVPGFTLFPSSRVSNPTTQTVMMRGLGGSGVNRSLVLADGIPLNDAFGGWVYWARIPQAAVDRVEVQRGGGGDLYGADAVGGVVQVLTIRPFRPTARGLFEGGSLGTGRVSAFGGGRVRGWRMTAAGQWFTTDGYVLVAEDDRGPIDTPSGSNHRSATASVGYQASRGWRVEGSASAFSENRTNGTPLQVNDTDGRQFSSEVTSGLRGGLLSARLFGGTQHYDQTFSELSDEPPRATEELNSVQRVPTRLVGVAVQWTRAWGRHIFLVGTEGKFVNGHAIETRFTRAQTAGPVHVETADVGGTARLGSAFVRATFAIGDRWTVVTGARGDGWQSESRLTPSTRTIGAFVPRLAVSYRAGDNGVTLRGSVYGGFRAPTLNELYRDARIGNEVTLANESLGPERLTAGDGGILVHRGRLSLQATGFWAVLDDTITNVTVSTSPSLDIRQRQNADRMRSAGVEIEADLRLPGSWWVGATSAIIDSRFAGQTRLDGYRVPHVARDSLAVNARHTGTWTVSGQLRITGPQFEDDVNALALRRATVVDVFGSRAIARGVSVFVAVENLFDADYDTGRAPIRLVGLPRAIRAGAQVTFP
jgi:outer membrane receptor protein involved in Fe transport